MTIRQNIRYWLYGSCPGIAGCFPYFGARVYFPKGSLLFQLACLQGIFEADNLALLRKLARSGSYFLDVGANIGLMSVPILRMVPDVRIISFEPSPNTLPWLRRTIEQHPHRDRWNLVPKAVGAEIGQATFSLATPENGAFDGIQDTQRVGKAGQATVEVTTLDHEWDLQGRPDVSVIKIDVEGGELAVLKGSLALLEKCRPFILLEWNKTNLKAYGIAPGTLYGFASSIRYRVYPLSFCVPVDSADELELYVERTESFLLVPSEVTGYTLLTHYGAIAHTF